MNDKHIARLTPEIIFQQLCNLGQIVFEVTDACNLNCTYCSYGDLYKGRDERRSKNLSFESAKTVIDYMVNIWQNNAHTSANQRVYISFYGGEPLMNMPLVKQIMEYVGNLPYLDRKFEFSMTTNALLLPKYMEFLQQNNIRILISLDGDERGDGHRVDHQGRNSFNRVFQNVKLLRDTYPSYFEKYVNFNSVIHDRNSIGEVTSFIKEHFNKTPSVSGLNNSNIDREKKTEFEAINRPLMSSVTSKEEFGKLIDESFMEIPLVNELARDIFIDSGNVFKSYRELFHKKNTHIIPTGTCLPFGKKLFLTVNDKILVCERIPQHFLAGNVLNGKVNIDFKKLAGIYNSYYDKIDGQCRICASLGRCMQCVFQMDDILSKKPICLNYISKEQRKTAKRNLQAFLGEYPHLYKKIMEEVTLY